MTPWSGTEHSLLCWGRDVAQLRSVVVQPYASDGAAFHPNFPAGTPLWQAQYFFHRRFYESASSFQNFFAIFERDTGGSFLSHWTRNNQAYFVLNPGPIELSEIDQDALGTFVPHRLALYVAGSPSDVFNVLQFVDVRIMERELGVLGRKKVTRFEWVVHTSLQEEFSRLLAEQKSLGGFFQMEKQLVRMFPWARQLSWSWSADLVYADPCLLVQSEVCVSVLCALPPTASRRLLTATLSFPSETELIIDFGGDVQRYRRFLQGTSVKIWQDDTIWRARLHVDVHLSLIHI